MTILPENNIDRHDKIVIVEEWYQSLIDDCIAIKTEAVFNSRWELLAGYHAIGKRIATEKNLKRQDIYGKKILRGLSNSIGMSEFNLYKAIQFYKKYPDITKLPDGKNISWTKVLKLLPEPPKPETPPLPEGTWRVFYADCPWYYTNPQHTDTYNGMGDSQMTTLETHYPSMKIEELCALPIKKMVQPDSVLFLWVTSPVLDQVWPVVEAWGFEYKSSIVWDKDAHNVGAYVSVRHEFLLICTRGSCTPDISELLPSVVKEKRTEHSVKPEIFRKMIDTMYPEGKRIELFARRHVEGWDAWGLDA